MGVDASKLESAFKRIGATRVHGALVAAGIDEARLMIGASPQEAPGCKAGVFPDGQHRNHYWLRAGDAVFEYLVQEPSTDFMPLGVPFFLADFKLSEAQLLDAGADLAAVRSSMQALGVRFELKGAGKMAPDEGIFLQQDAQAISAYYTERGQDQLLFRTRYAWAAGLAIAWSQNYKKLKFA